MKELPISAAADRNKSHIADALQSIITKEDRSLFEIGSGTGQHAVYLASYFNHLKWQTSDLLVNHDTINAHIENANLNNVFSPLEYEAGKNKFPHRKYDLVYTANTFHIMSWKNVKTTLKSVHQILNEGGQFLIYGPFNYGGEFTSESNMQFDLFLKKNSPESGIRNFEDIQSNLKKNDIHFSKQIDMPANNKLLVFTKIAKIIDENINK